MTKGGLVAARGGIHKSREIKFNIPNLFLQFSFPATQFMAPPFPVTQSLECQENMSKGGFVTATGGFHRWKEIEFIIISYCSFLACNSNGTPFSSDTTLWMPRKHDKGRFCHCKRGLPEMKSNWIYHNLILQFFFAWNSIYGTPFSSDTNPWMQRNLFIVISFTLILWRMG